MIYKTLLGEDIDMDVEIWKPYKTLHTDIEVSNWGNIRGKKWFHKKFDISMLKQGNDGRWRIGTKLVYRLVDLVFNGPKPKYEIDVHHLDGDPSNDKLDNLQRLPHGVHASITQNNPKLIKYHKEKWDNPKTNPNATKNKESIEKSAKAHRGTKHYNNGIIGILVHYGEEIPEGFIPGKLKT